MLFYDLPIRAQLLRMNIPFNKPHLTGNEVEYIVQAHTNAHLAGDGPFTKNCHDWLESSVNSARALLTHSCTAALEMSAMLLELKEGDEVIMPSYTFVSTANAFALRGAKPVFVDIREDTLNIDERLLEAAITKNTKAIVPVHYAGVACEMDSICDLANSYNLTVVEDAAQGVMSSYKGRALGSIGGMGTYSFHETKNVISGEGGALLVNDQKYVERAEIIREKGTNRSQFFRGQVDKYTWQDLGSSFLPGEIIAAFLWAQLEHAREITDSRIDIWNNYHSLFEPYELQGLVRRPVIPEDCVHNGHMYYLILPDSVSREQVLSDLSNDGINAVFHYVPLHDAPAGKKFGTTSGTLDITENLSARLIRLPFWIGLSGEQQEKICSSVIAAVKKQVAK